MIEILKYLLLNIINISNATIIIVNVAYYCPYQEYWFTLNSHTSCNFIFSQTSTSFHFISLDASTHQPEVTKDGVFHRVGMSVGAGFEDVTHQC
jgi:hypothetical protein